MAEKQKTQKVKPRDVHADFVFADLRGRPYRLRFFQEGPRLMRWNEQAKQWFVLRGVSLEELQFWVQYTLNDTAHQQLEGGLPYLTIE